MSAVKPTLATAGTMLALGAVLQGTTPGNLFSDQVVRPTYVVGSFVGLVGCFVLQLALLSMHRRVSERTGRGGQVSALAAGFGGMLLFAVSWSTAFVDPAAARTYPAFIDEAPPAILVAGFFGSLLWFGLSWLVYAVMAMRSGTLPRRPLVAVAVGALAVALPFVPFGMVVFGAGLTWLGLASAGSRKPMLVAG